MDQAVTTNPEQPVLVGNGLCSRFRCTQSGCDRCQAVCPIPGTVELSDNGVAIDDRCVACGLCVAACPNGALQLQESDRALGDKIRPAVTAHAVFRLACDQADVDADFIVPCLGRLTEALLLEPLRAGASGVLLLAPECIECGLRKAAPLCSGTAKFAQAVLESCNWQGVEIATATTPRLQSGERVRRKRADKGIISRRALFRSLADKFDSAPETPCEERAGTVAPALFRDLVRQHHDNPKRSHLLEVLTALGHGEIKSRKLAAAQIPLAQPRVDEKCVGCDVCEMLCPVGAIAQATENGLYTLTFRPELCTGCSVCQDACFHRAVTLEETVDVSVLHRRRQKVLYSTKSNTCQLCGTKFPGGDPELKFCPLCMATSKRQMGIAQRLAKKRQQHER